MVYERRIHMDEKTNFDDSTNTSVTPEEETTSASSEVVSAFSMPEDPSSGASATEETKTSDTYVETPITSSTEETDASSGNDTTTAVSDPYSNTQATYSSTEPASDFSNGFAIASLVLGILSILFACCCTILGIILGIIGIVLGCLQKPNPETEKKPGLAIAGIICSSVGIVLCIASGVLGAASVLKNM